MTAGPGAILGSYELVQLLARGGMGEVYRARHRRLTGREVAIKVMPAVLAADPTFLQRFEREANNIASLNHPHILPLWDYGEQDGLPYIVMPLVLGGSLRDRMRGRRMAPAEVLRYLQPIADALDYAHALGIVHRDIKPANILLDDRDHVFVADFGIAKATQGGPEQLTRTGVGIGTPEYMAPEQTQGQADPRSDIYALGIIAYECLAGKVPYTGKTPIDVAIKHATVPIPPLDPLGAVASPALDAVVRRALAKAPDDRFATAGDFARAFAASCGAAGTAGEEAPTAALPSPGNRADLPTRAVGAVPDRTAQLPPGTPPPPSPPGAMSAAAAPAAAPRRLLAITLVIGLVLGLGLAIGAVAALNLRDSGQQIGGRTSEPTATVSGGAPASALPYAFPITTAVLAAKYEEARGRLPAQAKGDAKLRDLAVACFNPRANADCDLTYRLYSRQTDTVYAFSFSIFDTHPIKEEAEPATGDYERTVFVKLPWEHNPAWPRLLSESYNQLPTSYQQGDFTVELTGDAATLNEGARDWTVKYTDLDSGEYLVFFMRGTRVIKES